MPLPSLREELALLPGPALADGQPSWTLHDPARNRFYRLDWATFEILHRWHLNDSASILDDLGQTTPLHLETADVDQVLRFLSDNQLLQPQLGSARDFAQRQARLEGSRLNWLLHHYLFFRVPLVRPDAWLNRWQHIAALLTTRTFAWLTLGAFLTGLSQVIRHWDGFLTSLVDSFNWEALVAYGAALFVVKLLHELGHAFTAKRFGCRIPSMGIAFLVLWPVAYTDTNDTWRLTSRGQRLRVACAGIATELVIAAWATLGWALLPDGALRSAAFVLATTSWVSTLAVNASPFMRFDGYFILSDWLDVPNLHERSFALARWQLREWLFGLGEEKPEHFPPGREKALIAFAWATWLYRLVIFLGIAILVYHFFIKLVGLLLFAVEIIWFIALPIHHELLAWRQRWPIIRRQRRSRITAAVTLALLVFAFIPWPTRVTASGILRATEVWPVFAPGASQLIDLPIAEGQRVDAGTVLLTLSAPELDVRRAGAQARLERLRWQAASSGFDADARNRLQSSQEELATAQAELGSIEQEMARYSPRAPFSGWLRDFDPDLLPGQWLAKKEKLAVLVGDSGLQVETYIDEESVKRISIGDQGLFLMDSGSGPAWTLTISNIDADAAHTLASRELALPVGGSVLVRERKGVFIPEHAVYRVTLTVASQHAPPPGHSLRGKVVIKGRWEAPAALYLRNATAVLIRETGF